MSDLPAWGPEIPASVFVQQSRELGLPHLEAGRPGYLSAPRGTHVVAGQVCAVLHDPEIRHLELPALDLEARRLHRMGAETLILSVLCARTPGGDKDLDPQGWALLLHSVGVAESIARRHLMRLAIHPQFGGILESAEAIEQILVHTTAGFCLDVGQLALLGIDPVDFAETCADRITHVHLKDVDALIAGRLRARQIGLREAVLEGVFCPPGEGSQRIDDLLRVLRRRNYRGWYVIEQESILGEGEEAAEEPAQNARRALLYLRGQGLACPA